MVEEQAFETLIIRESALCASAILSEKFVYDSLGLFLNNVHLFRARSFHGIFNKYCRCPKILNTSIPYLLA